ncbi:uncharacterized protein [Pseudorasbora parva]|uniref:uncharacterized protein isoform X2 n=1 Tax=Pseudorasbora parva TaxID=51549 RepID=UPI00351F5D52
MISLEKESLANVVIIRNKFPAVLTTQLALDRRCVTLLKPRTAGNSSSFLQQALEEVHSEEWARRSSDGDLTDCEFHKERCALTQTEVVYQQPPPFCPLPLAQCFETVHANEIVSHLEELKGVITSTDGNILKLDSTKKITKKLAGGIADTATWMTNVGNEFGQVLNCVLTTGEGAGLDDLCQGIVKRYKDAGEPEPVVIYVDRDCCSETGVTQVLTWFRPWKVTVRLDVFHFMRRFTAGLTTEHHPLYGTFCSKLSSCIFEWDLVLKRQKELLEQTNLLLVRVNNTTVSSWLLDRQRRTDRDTLLQGVELPQPVGLAKEPLPKPRELPSAPDEHGHVAIEFQEPENQEGEAVICQRKYARTGTAVSSITHTDTELGNY